MLEGKQCRHFLCKCTGEMIQIERENVFVGRDEKNKTIHESQINFAIYLQGIINHEYSLKERLRHCWQILKHKKPYSDYCMLDLKEAKRMGETLIQLVDDKPAKNLIKPQNNEFKAFNKIPRLSRDIVITEKIDGTNAQIYITENGEMKVGSRTRWIDQHSDNHGFAKWAYANKDELMKLGPGRHFGEWWGKGINRGYDGKEKTLSLFNVTKWSDPTLRPACCDVVPTLFKGSFTINNIEATLNQLKTTGSVALPGYMNPEGIVIFHTASNHLFKKTIENDEKPKKEINETN